MFLINISSFSIGIVAVMFLFLFVVKEFKADKFHHKYKDIYRVLEKRIDAPSSSSQTCYPMGNLLKSSYSEIQDFTRFIDGSYYSVRIGEKQFLDQNISFVDSSFFKIFDFKLDAGDYNQIFKNPNTAIVDRKTAKRYFNTTDVLGKTIEIQIPGQDKENTMLTIVGILTEYPEESTLKPQIIADIKIREKEYVDEYFSSSPQLFLYIPNCNNIPLLSQNLAKTFFGRLNDLRTKKYEIDSSRLYLQKLSDMYLHSSHVDDDNPKGDFMLLWILICVGSVLLIITFINYIILNVGLSLKNQKQNQINKILGGSSGWLKKKYIFESVYYTITAFFLALLLLPFVHKTIISFADYPYGLFSKSDLQILFSFLLAVILLGILSGFIQYFVLATGKKSETELIKSSSQLVFFKYMVPVQLFVFILTITGLFIITKQVKFIRSQDLGYDIENTITVSIRDYNDKKLFVQEFEQNKNVNKISIGHSLFNTVPYLNEVTIDNSQTEFGSQTIFGDQNYIDVYKIRLLSGTNINGDDFPPVETSYSYQNGKGRVIDILVNEEFVRKSGLKNPLGTIVTIQHNGTSKGRITGIVENVKNLPIYHSVTPMVIGYGFSHGPDIIVSVNKGQMEAFKKDAVSFIKRIGKESHYDTFSFDFDVWYKKELTLMHLLTAFSVIVLVILMLGLVGTSLFIAERKTKEIGIRKINGATISEVITMLNHDFVKWVAIAFVIATPIAYYAMNKWLESFAYKTELSWWIFALAGLLALGIALLTVSWQSWKAATRNPVEALRYE